MLAVASGKSHSKRESTVQILPQTTGRLFMLWIEAILEVSFLVFLYGTAEDGGARGQKGRNLAVTQFDEFQP